MEVNHQLSPEQQDTLLHTLKTQFEKNKNRHAGLDWSKVEAKLETNPGKLWSLEEIPPIRNRLNSFC